MATELSLPQARRPTAPRPRPAAGVGPYRLAARRLWRDRTALAFGALFLLIVVLCLVAPVYARDVAHTGPNDNHVTDTVRVGGQTRDVVSPDGIPLGPTWHGRFFLGADQNGRDIAVRLLYGGRNSPEIGAIATAITIVLATIAGGAAGYFRGVVDSVVSRMLDLIWAYPVVLLGIALGTSLALGGLNLGLFTLHGNSLLVPALVIGFVYIPYVAKPVRAQVLSLRERDFVDAARLQGLGSVRILWLVLGVLLGVLGAVRAGGLVDRSLTALAMIGVSTPVFLLGALLLYGL